MGVGGLGHVICAFQVRTVPPEGPGDRSNVPSRCSAGRRRFAVPLLRAVCRHADAVVGDGDQDLAGERR